MYKTLNVVISIVLAIPFVAFMVFLPKNFPWRRSKRYGVKDPTPYTWGALFRDCRTSLYERSRRRHSTRHDA